MIPENYIPSSTAEKEYGLYSGAIRKDIQRKRIKEEECVKIAGIWFVDRAAVERVYGKKEGPETIEEP